MNWFTEILMNSESVAHIVVLYAVVISVGILLGKTKVAGVSLGVTFVLFAGIIAGHILHQCNISESSLVLNSFQDFGLILFVFSIGIQVGPSFLTSFSGKGVRMNLIAVGIVLLNIAVMFGIYYSFCDTSDPQALPMMVGVLCGAVTNTPGLGAANAALEQIGADGLGATLPNIANGYACAYPFGVIGIICSIILIKYIFKIDLKKEEENLIRHIFSIDLKKEEENHNNAINQDNLQPQFLNLEITNASLDNKTILELCRMLDCKFVCSRCLHEGHTQLPDKDTKIYLGDRMSIVCAEKDAEAITSLIGKPVHIDWKHQNFPTVSRTIVVTRDKANGKELLSLHPNRLYGVNVTRIYRSGIEMFAFPNVMLKTGDRLTVVGSEDAIDRFARKVSKSNKHSDKPDIMTLFLGILVGIIFGSIPFSFSGMSVPIKFGLAGGPLIIAILIGRFGFKLKLATYSTANALLMIRDIGLVLFLASVGIKAGGNFIETVTDGGYMYVLYGVLITMIPLVIMGCVARMFMKTNYLTLMGIMAGATTDPPALAYSAATASNDIPSVGYSTVYPLSMFLRIVTAQIIILAMCA